MTNEEQMMAGGRIFGKTNEQLLNFFVEGKKGLHVVYATPEGNFLSPKAVENTLHQAELNWVTAQIEKGEGMFRDQKKKDRDSTSCGSCGSTYPAICKCHGYNFAITDFLSPLIERKKELEKLLGKKTS